MDDEQQDFRQLVRESAIHAASLLIQEQHDLLTKKSFATTQSERDDLDAQVKDITKNLQNLPKGILGAALAKHYGPDFFNHVQTNDPRVKAKLRIASGHANAAYYSVTPDGVDFE